MSETAKQACIDSEGHQLHICQVKKKGLLAEVAARTDDPGYICHNCSAVANRAETLCNPSPLIKR